MTTAYNNNPFISSNTARYYLKIARPTASPPRTGAQIKSPSAQATGELPKCAAKPPTPQLLSSSDSPSLSLIPSSDQPSINVLLVRIREFFKAIDAEALHISSSAPSDMVLDHVAPGEYEAIKSMIDIEMPHSNAAKVSRLNYYADGRLIITFPSKMHEIMSEFGDTYFLSEMWNQQFCWNGWDKEAIGPGKSTDVRLNLEEKDIIYIPDASLMLKGHNMPFLVCEVAVSQRLSDVMKKREPYLLGSKGQIKLFIIIHIESKRPSKDGPAKRQHGSVPLLTNKRGRSDHEQASWSGRRGEEEPEDSVPTTEVHPSPDTPQTGPPPLQYVRGSIYVYTTKLKSGSAPGKFTRYIVQLVKDLEFWPRVPTEQLLLKWNDLIESGIQDDAKGNELKISYTFLHNKMVDYLNPERLVETWEDGDDVEIERLPPSDDDDGDDDDDDDDDGDGDGSGGDDGGDASSPEDINDKDWVGGED